MTDHYLGTELELFATARNWKTYVAAALAPYVRGRVLDVGAGIGGNIGYLLTPKVTEWVALEPDPNLASAIKATVIESGCRASCTVVTGTIDRMEVKPKFDTILYMDVLEHIEDDRQQVHDAARLLNPGGCLVVLVPAHQFLFSPFDAAIGHYRRYGLEQLRALTPPSFRTEVCRLMDCVGFFASLANRMVLRQSDPTAGQIALWDRVMVRASRIFDPLMLHRFGKSALVVWRAETHA